MFLVTVASGIRDDRGLFDEASARISFGLVLCRVNSPGGAVPACFSQPACDRVPTLA